MADRMKYGHQDTSPFHAYLEQLFSCHVDVQWTTGRLNYINGYTTKAQDAMDFRLDAETSPEGKHSRWKTAYRLLCRKTVCIPEVALWFYEAKPMIRNFRVGNCYAPIPWRSELKNNNSERLYDFYLQQDNICRKPFLDYCRLYKSEGGKLKPYGKSNKRICIGVRYASEMRDQFVGQLACMHMPHSCREQLFPDSTSDCDFQYVRCLLGFINYLLQLTLNADGTIGIGSGDYYASPTSFFVSLPIQDGCTEIFRTRDDAYDYIERLLLDELTVRSLPQARTKTAQFRLRASYYLAFGIVAPTDRAVWNKVASGSIKEVTLSTDQQMAMDYWVRHFDVGSAEDHLKSIREIHIVGKPGSGKTELFVQFCAHAIANRLRVLILCPTGQLVATYRQRLPDCEFIRIETIHAGMAIYREKEALVNHAPPSTLNRYDAILLDECSQIDNATGKKVAYAIDELPQRPFVAIAADYKQLQSVVSKSSKLEPARSFMASISKKLTTITLNTIYRTDDPALLDFLNLARDSQPMREDIFEFFQYRRWRFLDNDCLVKAVEAGLSLEKAKGEPFVWLCVTNDGARRVCRAALELLGLGDYSSKGYPTDPNQGESQRFYANPGVVVRLTRNVDKDRGYVNGAVGVVRLILSRTRDGDVPTVFTVELSTGVHIVVHPIFDKISGSTVSFLPCVYGYATTIRRAQGATYRHGAIWFNHRYPPDRGYGYVAASRFKSKDGLYLFGSVRRTDWLPVRDSVAAMDDDQIERSSLSGSDYDSEEEERNVRPLDYCDSERSDYGDSDVNSFADYEDRRDEDLAGRDEEQLYAEYNFSFSNSARGGGLPDLADL